MKSTKEINTSDDQLYNDDMNALEKLVDTNGINVTLDMLFEICCLKSEHLQSNWQDKTTAEFWEHVAKQIDSIDRDYTLI